LPGDGVVRVQLKVSIGRLGGTPLTSEEGYELPVGPAHGRPGNGGENENNSVCALAFAIGSSASQADELSASQARYAAMSLVDGQGARAIVSNVLAPANGAHFAPCQVQVSFVGADGSMIGKATMVQLKAGESTSVSASNPSKLVRAIVSIGDVVDPAKICALRTSVEIFDVQTGTTLVSVPGESIGSENSVATTSSLSGVTVSQKN
jgi:hypothetical protein